jgi:hypothetical protein
MQKPEMSANVNVYWGVKKRAFSGDILETYISHVPLALTGGNSLIISQGVGDEL